MLHINIISTLQPRRQPQLKASQWNRSSLPHTSASPPPSTCPALLLSIGAAEKLPRGVWQARQLRVEWPSPRGHTERQAGCTLGLGMG